MKKKILSLIFALALVFSFASCDELFKKQPEETTEGECVHEYGDWVTLKAADCRNSGLRSRVCTKCLETDLSVIEKTAHDFDEWFVVEEGSCTEDRVLSRACKVCFETEFDFIQATGHTAASWVTVTEPDCTTEGLRECVCSVCGEGDKEILPALGHDYEDPTVTKEANCLETGIRTGHCRRCDQDTDEVIPALGHNYGDWTEKTAAGCETKGSRERVCERCSTVSADEIPALGHDYGEWTTVSESDCRTPGERRCVCRRCSKTVTEELPLAAHRFENGECVVCHTVMAGSVGLKYSLSSDGSYYVVTGIGTCTDVELVIPETYNGLPVKAIGIMAFRNCTRLVSVEIPESVVDCGVMPFTGCTGLRTVILHSKVDTFPTGYLCADTAVTKVVISKYVKRIDGAAFYGCKTITTLEFEGTVAEWKKIELTDAWDHTLKATTVVCSDGTVKI